MSEVLLSFVLRGAIMVIGPMFVNLWAYKVKEWILLDSGWRLSNSSDKICKI